MASRSAGTGGQLRIIGGRWRGRKLRFRAVKGLRPTPDRVRETLFNWLSSRVPGSRCLDLFAGSGALGLEALSRGAAWCCFVESHAGSARSIREHLVTLNCESATCIQGEAARFLEPGCDREPFDLVFLDPPFGEQVLDATCASLESGGWLADTAFIYLESSVRAPQARVPENWQQHREKSAGEVRFQLFVRERQFV